ncbi:DUF3325 family protein [Massilia violaceinigra]|uniref:DUF3325 family protein n=1 Tax=Massilia violaceinigra TaxID=2045208 RepID=A0ABY4A6Q0_9BURK|nr:DUF3325 family protein [Massilia violaceinigra]UOD29679.1 DUF3325 family protein [Massilia violaceinigra]
MNALLMAAGSACAAWAGMAVLCFQSASQRRRLGLREQGGREQGCFILAGTVLIAISLAAAVGADGSQFGVLLWLCQTGMLGMALICSLPFARTAVTASARLAALLAPLSLAAASWM